MGDNALRTESALDFYFPDSHNLNCVQETMSPGRQRPSAVEKCPATTTAPSRQSPRILVVDIHPPHWDHTCRKLCEALENVFCLACSLTGPPRIPSFSLYVVQNQQECLLPFVVSAPSHTQARLQLSEISEGPCSTFSLALAIILLLYDFRSLGV